MANSIRLLIKNGTLIDGSGDGPVPNKLIVVDGNRITVVGGPDGSMRPETPDDAVIDTTGKFILPGLIDAHCHISLHQGALSGMKYTSTAEFLHPLGGACDRARAARRGDQHRCARWQMVYRCYRARGGRGRVARGPAHGRRGPGPQQLWRHFRSRSVPGF